MVTVLALLGVLAVLFVAAVLATRDDPLLADAPADAADVPLPDGPLQPEDVRGLRFSLAARGYRMPEVDRALDRLAAELADRDRRIALLEAAAQGHEEPVAAAPVREAGPEDLPAAAEPVPALEVDAAPEELPAAADGPSPTSPVAAVPPTTAAWSNPAAVPEFPVIAAPETAGEPLLAPDASIAEVPRELAPLPPADLGAELRAQERVEEAPPVDDVAPLPARDAAPADDVPTPPDDAEPADDVPTPPDDAEPADDDPTPAASEGATGAEHSGAASPDAADEPPQHGSAAATGAVSGDDLTAALEETGDRPHH